MAYDASIDRIIADYNSGGTAGAKMTWLFDIRTGAWSRPGVEMPDFVVGIWAVPAIAYDEAAERTVFIGNARWAAYDAAADRWEVLAERGGSFPLPTVYDPVNRRLVGLGLGGTVVQGDVVAFDLVTREWTVLLESSEGQPAP